ncbi:unnamed protein product, partial [Porites evermanni]
MADDLLYHFSDEDDDEDALFDRAFDRWEQLGGGSARGPLFQFTMQPIGRRRHWREVVERAQFNAQLRQLRDPVPGDNIGMALTEALHQAIETELDREQRPAYHFVNFAITAHGFTHAYQTANFTVGEFLQRIARLDEMLATLAGKLNSNEAFNPDRGFQVDVVFVSMPGPGSGRHKQRNPGRLYAAPRVVDLIVRIMCAVPAPRSIAVCVTASFTAGIANVIMKSPSNVSRSKPVSSARPSTRSSITNVTSVGTPSVPCVEHGC